MYFVTYQYASFSEAGILTADFKRVVPVTTIGKVLGIKLPEQMTDFIRLADDALIASIEKAMADNPNMGINLNSVKLLAPIPKPERNIFCLGKTTPSMSRRLKIFPASARLRKAPFTSQSFPHRLLAPIR